MALKIIGLTGGIGSGKSEVSKILSEHHGYLIDADKINHEMMLKGSKAYTEIVDIFGKSIIKSDGEIDRKALADIVFADKEKLDQLVAVNHKYVIEETFRRMRAVQANPADYRFIVVDAPLLIEAGLHTSCDLVCVVESDLTIRINRIMARDNVTDRQAFARVMNQMPADEMRTYADYIITNNGGIGELTAAVTGLLEKL